MKTYIITPQGTIEEDTRKLRQEIFKHIQEFSGCEFSPYDREQFARRYVYENDQDDNDQPVTPTWQIYYSNRDTNPTDSTLVGSGLPTEAAAQDIALQINQKLELDFIKDDSNFCLIDLPNEIIPEMDYPKRGTYPTSSYVNCRLTYETTTAEDQASWRTQHVGDDWNRPQVIKENLLGLIVTLIQQYHEDQSE